MPPDRVSLPIDQLASLAEVEVTDVPVLYLICHPAFLHFVDHELEPLTETLVRATRRVQEVAHRGVRGQTVISATLKRRWAGQSGWVQRRTHTHHDLPPNQALVGLCQRILRDGEPLLDRLAALQFVGDPTPLSARDDRGLSIADRLGRIARLLDQPRLRAITPDLQLADGPDHIPGYEALSTACRQLLGDPIEVPRLIVRVLPRVLDGPQSDA